MINVFSYIYNLPPRAWKQARNSAPTIISASFLSVSAALCVSPQAIAEEGTQYINLKEESEIFPLYDVSGLAGTDGNSDINSTVSDGLNAYIITADAESIDKKSVSVDEKVNITAGKGGQGIDLTVSGGNGGIAIEGSDFKIINNGTINGGEGGAGGEGDGNPANSVSGKGGLGGAAISGNNIDLDNYYSVTGGAGGHGGTGFSNNTHASAGGNGGTAFNVTNGTVNNFSGATITGGQGGESGYSFGRDTITDAGGNGGDAITGLNLTINNDQGATLKGGNGGKSGDVFGFAAVSNQGGGGGKAISGNSLTVTNGGETLGGNGGNGGSGGIDQFDFGWTGPGNGGKGGEGSSAISGDRIFINNTGLIQAGNGGDGGNGSTQSGSQSLGGDGGNGGDAISGSNLTIINSGIITRGVHGTAGIGLASNGVDGSDGVAIQITGGTNTLTLEKGSTITGDIVLSSASASTANTLDIINNTDASINGSLTAGSQTSVTLSGTNQTAFTGKAVFGNQSVLSFAEGSSLAADTINFSDTTLRTTINHWTQKEITLITTENGISGNYLYGAGSNPLLTTGAKDYADIFISDDNKTLTYSLKWNDVTNTALDAWGTFDLKAGAELDLSTELTDNTQVTADNQNGWDGKSLTKSGMGTLLLSGVNTYTGATHVDSGTLKLGVADAISSTSGIEIAKGATLDLGGNNQQLGSGATINNAGTLLLNSYSEQALLNTVTVSGDMINSGTLTLNNCTTCAGQTYTQNGNWIGKNGTVTIGTVLGDDNSLTDKLVITGSATGTTYVTVSNENGTGGKTLEGIEVISTGDSTANAFVQRGRIAAGSYDYFLQQGTASGQNMNNWYLTTLNDEVITYRPERGSYASNLQAAGTLFNTRLEERQGYGVYIDPVTGKRDDTSLWARAVGGHSKGLISDGQSRYNANRMVFQLGGDLFDGSLTGNDAWHLGVMGGYGKQYSTTINNLSGYKSKGSVWGYSAGLYSTWYQNAQDKSGLYADTWMLYNWFDNSVKGDELGYEKYKSKGLTASLEAGYVFHAGTYTTSGGMENNFYLTPQAQVIWSGVRADNHTEQNGTEVEGRGNDNVQSRVGLRLSMSSQQRSDNKPVRQFAPFIEANWLHSSKQYGVRMGDESAYIQGSHNVAEIKTGIEGRVTEHLNVSASVGQQMGSQDYRDTQGMLNVKYNF